MGFSFWNKSDRLTDGVWASGGPAGLSSRGCFEHWLSCEYQTLYCLDSRDLIYQNEVIHPPGEDKLSFQRINQAHHGPCSPPYLQRGRERTVINLTGPRQPPEPHVRYIRKEPQDSLSALLPPGKHAVSSSLTSGIVLDGVVS